MTSPSSNGQNRESIHDLVEYTYLCCEQIFHFTPKLSIQEVVSDFTSLAANTRPLAHGEKGIVSLLKPKTAALLGERVWLPFPGRDDDPDFVFGWDSPVAIRMSSLMAFTASKLEEGGEAQPARPNLQKFLNMTERELSEDYARASGLDITPLYSSSEARDKDHQAGQRAVVVSAIENVGVVSEELLTWEQVEEFRNDYNCREAYRRFVHWLDRDMIDKSAEYIVDEVSERLEAYRSAIKKHGLRTALGTVERTLDAKSLGSAAAASLSIQTMTSLPLLSILGGAGLLVGNAAVHAGLKMVERKDITDKNKEVAFVHQVKEKLGQTET